MTETQPAEPVVKELEVERGAVTAFRVFTAEIGLWWPTETHALHPGAVREVVWEGRAGGAVYEIATDGTRAPWATVTAWEPPVRLAISWHVNPEAPATDVEVTFAEAGGRTQVRLVHAGWERLGDAAGGTRADYDEGWTHVLGRYEAALA